jgi:hypothetical protein
LLHSMRTVGHAVLQQQGNKHTHAYAVQYHAVRALQPCTGRAAK